MSAKAIARAVKPSGMGWTAFTFFAIFFAFVVYVAGNGSLVKYKAYLL